MIKELNCETVSDEILDCFLNGLLFKSLDSDSSVFNSVHGIVRNPITEAVHCSVSISIYLSIRNTLRSLKEVEND